MTTQKVMDHDYRLKQREPVHGGWDQAAQIVYLEQRNAHLQQQLDRLERLSETRITFHKALEAEHKAALAHLEKKHEQLKRMANKLAKTKKGLEKEVEKRTRDLEQKNVQLDAHAQQLKQANIALDVLVRKHQRDRNELVQGVINQWRDDVMPMLERLRRLSPSDEYRILVDTILSKLLGIGGCTTSSGSLHSCLTEREHEVALLIAEGRSCREVSQLLRITLRCVQSHCYSIRKKMNLSREIRLKTHLKGLLFQ